MAPPIVVGITGATGVVYGIELLRALQRLGRPVRLIVSEMAARTLQLESDVGLDEVRSLAEAVHSNKDLAAAVASGSFATGGMVIAPCSVKTLSGIANSFSHNLMIRAADVTLKERRPLVLLFRETPLHAGHLRLMLQAVEMGAVMLPPLPSFYNRPRSLADLVEQTVARTLDQFGIVHDLGRPWTGPPPPAAAP
jgi:4-hydroxy-3-polyprenylbenzoate decarboxylase